jgi:glycerol-3-phosphate dehydrogenase
MQQAVKSNILVLGAGSFGLCLADHLGDSEHDVYLWSRSRDFCDHFNQHYRSIRQLPEHQFPTCITAVGPEFPDRALVDKIDVLLFAIPTEGVRYVPVQCETTCVGVADSASFEIEPGHIEAAVKLR